jgi:hypothetical protein
MKCIKGKATHFARKHFEVSFKVDLGILWMIHHPLRERLLIRICDFLVGRLYAFSRVWRVSG